MQYRFIPLAAFALTTIGISGCDHDDYYRHAYSQPPVIVVQAPTPAPAPAPPPAPTYVAPPPYPYYQPYPYYAPAPVYYGGPGYGYYGRRGGDD